LLGGCSSPASHLRSTSGDVRSRSANLTSLPSASTAPFTMVWSLVFLHCLDPQISQPFGFTCGTSRAARGARCVYSHARARKPRPIAYRAAWRVLRSARSRRPHLSVSPRRERPRGCSGRQAGEALARHRAAAGAARGPDRMNPIEQRRPAPGGRVASRPGRAAWANSARRTWSARPCWAIERGGATSMLVGAVRRRDKAVTPPRPPTGERAASTIYDAADRNGARRVAAVSRPPHKTGNKKGPPCL